MSFGSPADPLSGAVITAAYAIANLLDPLRWLRAMTGGGDPPASNRVVVSLSTTTTQWTQVPTDALADGSVTAAKLGPSAVVNQLGYVPANKVGDQFLGQVFVLKPGASASSTMYANAHIQVQTNDGGIPAIGFHRVGTEACAIYELSNRLYFWGADNVSGRVVIDPDTSATPGAGKIPIADGSGKLDAWVTAAAGIPTGLGCWVRQASEIPSGWSRETNLDGRIPVGAGTTFSVTYVEATNYGASWSHGHTGATHNHSTPAHQHSGASLSVSGTTNGPSTTGNYGSAGGVAADGSHTHGWSGGVAGTTANDGNSTSGGASASATSSDAWVIPSRAVVWCRKN